jgi:predicted SAM-dependent methyltransferase
LTLNSVDIVYAYSVFSHTIEEDMRAYVKDFSRILADDGKLFFTTFVEEDVPNVSINPRDYRMKCEGPLHIVKYRKDYLFSIINESGYSMMSFTEGTEADGQSAIYLCKKNE